MLCSIVVLLAFYSTHCSSEERPSQLYLPADYIRRPEDSFSPSPLGGALEPAYGYLVITSPFYYREIYAPAFHPHAGIPFESFPQDPNSVYDVPYNTAFMVPVNPNIFNENSKIPGNFASSVHSLGGDFPNYVQNPEFPIPNAYAPSYSTNSQYPYDKNHNQNNIPPLVTPNYFPTNNQNPQLYSPQSPSTNPSTVPTLFTSTSPNIIREEATTNRLDKANTPSYDPSFLSSSFGKSFSPSNVPMFVPYDSSNIIRGENPISVKSTSIYPGSSSSSFYPVSSSPNPFNPVSSSSTPLNPTFFNPVPSSTPLPAPGTQSFFPSSSTPGYPEPPTPGTVFLPSNPFDARPPTSVFNTSTEIPLYHDTPPSESPPPTHIFYEAPGHESPQ